jgi:hypothetical protein
VPLQKWMTEHDHPGWYSWLVVIGGALTSMVVAVGISITLNERGLERERAQREQARAATCLVIRQMENVYADPSTETGEKARAAWTDLGRTFGCKE